MAEKRNLVQYLPALILAIIMVMGSMIPLARADAEPDGDVPISGPPMPGGPASTIPPVTGVPPAATIPPVAFPQLPDPNAAPEAAAPAKPPAVAYVTPSDKHDANAQKNDQKY